MDHLPLAVIVDVLKQLEAWQVAAGFDDARQPRVAEIDGVLDEALASKLEPDFRSPDGRVPVFHRRQPIRPRPAEAGRYVRRVP